MTLFKITVPYTLISARTIYVLANDPTEAIKKAEEKLEQPIKYTTIEAFLREDGWVNNSILIT